MSLSDIRLQRSRNTGPVTSMRMSPDRAAARMICTLDHPAETSLFFGPGVFNDLGLTRANLDWVHLENNNLPAYDLNFADNKLGQASVDALIQGWIHHNFDLVIGGPSYCTLILGGGGSPQNHPPSNSVIENILYTIFEAVIPTNLYYRGSLASAGEVRLSSASDGWCYLFAGDENFSQAEVHAIMDNCASHTSTGFTLDIAGTNAAVQRDVYSVAQFNAGTIDIPVNNSSGSVVFEANPSANFAPFDTGSPSLVIGTQDSPSPEDIEQFINDYFGYVFSAGWAPAWSDETNIIIPYQSMARLVSQGWAVYAN